MKPTIFNITLKRKIVTALVSAVILFGIYVIGCQAQKKEVKPSRIELKPSPIKPSVKMAETGTKFIVRVGGGTNITPPDTYGGGDDVPAISMSGNSAFLAGEVTSHDSTMILIKIVCDFENPLNQPHSFKIGDVAIIVDNYHTDDFLAVGYDAKLCAMSGEDHKAVEKIMVSVGPKETRTLSYIFAIPNRDYKQDSIMIGNAKPVSFHINSGGEN